MKKMAGTDHRRHAGEGGPQIILVRAQLGQNIGTAARAMANFGLGSLRLVAPRDGWPSDYAIKAASGADHVVENAALYGDTASSIADLNFVYATTARSRDMAKFVFTPEQAAADMHRRMANGEKLGILFGPERTGLHNDDVSLADAFIMAPVCPAFASLNLAQAVLLIAYEWYKPLATSLGDGSREDGPGREGLHMRKSRAATKEELLGFFEHLERELDDSGFLRPVEKRPAMVRNLRNLFQRGAMTEQEVRTLRGVVASLSRGRHRRR